MKVKTSKINLLTAGNSEIVDITDKIKSELTISGLADGLLTVFVPGATGAITTVEYEPGLIKDLQKLFQDIVKEKGIYNHDSGNPKGNAPSHLRASMIGPSLSVPFENGKMQLGVWQQIIFIDFDNSPREREVIIKIIGN